MRLYEVVFPSGSTFITDEVKRQAISVYNAIPEEQFATVKVSGNEEGDFGKSILFNLARQRTNNLNSFFTAAGCSPSNVKISYALCPQLLIFKPKGKLQTSSKLKVNILTDYRENHFIDAEKRSAIETNKKSVLVFEQGSFETMEGYPIRKGMISITIVEISDADEIIKTGVLGNVKREGVAGVSFFKINATKEGKKLRLRKGVLYEVNRRSEEVFSNLFIGVGYLEDDILTWSPRMKHRVFRRMLTPEEHEFLLGANPGDYSLKDDTPYMSCAFSSLDWVAVFSEKQEPYSHDLKIKLKSRTDFAIYLKVDSSNLLLPAYKNSSYFNRYEFKSVPSGLHYKIVGIPENELVSEYIYVELVGSNSTFETLETIPCDQASVFGCIPSLK